MITGTSEGEFLSTRDTERVEDGEGESRVAEFGICLDVFCADGTYYDQGEMMLPSEDMGRKGGKIIRLILDGNAGWQAADGRLGCQRA